MNRLFLFVFLLFSSLSGKIPQKVVICGVCKDVEESLPNTIQIIEQMGSFFEDWRAVVYENNSKDKTKNILAAWAKSNSKVFVQAETLSHAEIASFVVNRDEKNGFFKTELIARARNIVLDHAMSDEYKDFAYLIWLDMDFKIPPRFVGLVEIFEANRDWDAVFAYGVAPDNRYWDWYAHRDETAPFGPEIFGTVWWHMPKQFELDFSSDWYPVFSAFGGCGVYKKSSIIGCRYSGVVNLEMAMATYELLQELQLKNNPMAAEYFFRLQYLRSVVEIPKAVPNLPKIKHRFVGISLFKEKCPIIWRMNTYSFQFPAVCEHIPFHGAMFLRGARKLYINPRFVFYY